VQACCLDTRRAGSGHKPIDRRYGVAAVACLLLTLLASGLYYCLMTWQESRVGAALRRDCSQFCLRVAKQQVHRFVIGMFGKYKSG